MAKKASTPRRKTITKGDMDGMPHKSLQEVEQARGTRMTKRTMEASVGMDVLAYPEYTSFFAGPSDFDTRVNRCAAMGYALDRVVMTTRNPDEEAPFFVIMSRPRQ